MKLGSKTHMDVPVISTGSLTVDHALGIGGLPRGRVVEIYGPESSGKTTLALHTVAELQKSGGTCTFIDAEHALDPLYASKIGVNINELYISQPDSGEQALEIADCLVRSGAMDMIVIDSVAALVPKAEAEGAMGDAHMALQARLMSQALRKITGSLAKSNCLLVFINQIRQKVGILFGNPEVTPGGNALKFYSSVRLDIRRKTAIKEGDDVIGYETAVKVVKNKLAPPFRTATFDMMFGTGISKTGEILDLAIEEGIIQKKGAWLSYQGENIAQGRGKAKEYLSEHPDFCQDLEAQIRQKWKEQEDTSQTSHNMDDSEESETFEVNSAESNISLQEDA